MISEKVFNEIVLINNQHTNFAGRNLTIPLARLCFYTFRVIANEAWLELPNHLKETTVAHEIGHREMGHASIPHNNLFSNVNIVIYGASNPKELEADRYACKMVGTEKYLIGLRGMLSLNRRLEASQSTLAEYEYRIKAIEDKKQLG